jgi:Domain of unknown function (DUF4265)
VGASSSGKPVYEDLLVDQLGDRTYRAVASPGFVLGLAAGDVFEFDSAESGHLTVLERGGNVSVQMYAPHGSTVDVDSLRERFGLLRGWFDGQAKNLVIFTVPVSAGFHVIEDVVNECCKPSGSRVVLRQRL